MRQYSTVVKSIGSWVRILAPLLTSYMPFTSLCLICLIWLFQGLNELIPVKQLAQDLDHNEHSINSTIFHKKSQKLYITLENNPRKTCSLITPAPATMPNIFMMVKVSNE